MTSPTTPGDAIDRREAIRRAALLLGGALSAPAVAGVLAGCGGGDARPESGRGGGGAASWTPRALTVAQAVLVATIAEHIIPTTDTPGARAAGVDRFIDTMLAEYYPAAERERFVAGLGDVDARARRECGRDFLGCDAARQRALLDRLDAEAFAATPAATPRAAPDPSQATERGTSGAKPPDAPRADTARERSARAAPAAKPPTPFFRTMKELTLLGYYTSEIGATRELRHVAVPGRFDGCVPLAQAGGGGRAWDL